MTGKIPLLMTASVSTRGMKGAMYSDFARESMYVEALSYYIRNLLSYGGYSIVFAEDSGWNINSIKEKLPSYDEEAIEFISINPAAFDVSKGKGYNELLMINRAVSASSLIATSFGFFKVTGRYPVYNIKHFY